MSVRCRGGRSNGALRTGFREGRRRGRDRRARLSSSSGPFSGILGADRPDIRAKGLPLQRMRPFPARRTKDYYQRPARRGSTLAAGQVLSMLAHGRLTAPPPFEADAVTNSVAGGRLPGAKERPVAKAISLEFIVDGEGSRSCSLRTGGRARRGDLMGSRQAASTPACASQILSPAREAPAS